MSISPSIAVSSSRRSCALPLSLCSSPTVVNQEREKRWANMPAASEFISMSSRLLLKPSFPPPATFLLRCSHTGLSLNEECIISFIHSSQRVIELICLMSVCWGAADYYLCWQRWNHSFKRWNKNVTASFNDSQLDISQQAFHRKYSFRMFFPPKHNGGKCHVIPLFHLGMSANFYEHFIN